MRNRNWALDIPQYDVRAFQKVGRTMALYDSWGGDSGSSDSYSNEGRNYSSPTYSSEAGPAASYGGSSGSSSSVDYSNEGRNYSSPTYSSEAGPAASYGGSSGSSSSVDYSNEGRNYPTGTTRPVNTSTWSVGADGQIYGNLQDAAKALGVKPSELNAAAYANNPLLKMFPGLKGMTSFIGKLQDLGLPGYAMTPEERAQQEAIYGRYATGGSSSGGTAGAGTGVGAGVGGPSGPNLPGLGGVGTGSTGTGMTPYWQGLMDQLQVGQYQKDPTGLVANAKATSEYFNSDVMPQWGLMRDAVNRYNDADFIQAQRAQAMGGVQQGADRGLAQAARAYKAQGGNINDGRFAALFAQQAGQTALNKVTAAAQSDAALRDAFMKGGASLLSSGNDMAKSAASLGAVGLDAEKTQNNWELAAQELGLKNRQAFASLALNEQNNLMDAAIRKYGIDNNVAINETNQDNELLGIVLGGLFGLS